MGGTAAMGDQIKATALQKLKWLRMDLVKVEATSMSEDVQLLKLKPSTCTPLPVFGEFQL